MTSRNIYPYWAAVRGTYNRKDGSPLNRRDGALIFPSEKREGAVSHVRDLLQRSFEGDVLLILELDPPATGSGARVGKNAISELLSTRRAINITDVNGEPASLPPDFG